MIRYLHEEIPELSGGFFQKGRFQLAPGNEMDMSHALNVSVACLKIAARIGVIAPALAKRDDLPYENDTLVYDAPLLSAMVSKEILFLRGWKEFDGCIKGFNALGLMAEVVASEMKRYKTMTPAKVNALKLEFLSSRKRRNESLFDVNELKKVTTNEWSEIDNFDLAIWRCFHNTTIVCSTSSNMGISCHQALRLMQKTTIKFIGQECTLLNENEGSLIIWCPDSRADFMNAEKAALLKSIEEEKPQITRLQTYINRQQRDPGALKDVLESGGYFFPTNPQSKEEMQNLLFVSFAKLAEERKVSPKVLFEDSKVKIALEHLGYSVQNDIVLVQKGMVSGLFGLMTPYFVMIEEFLKFGRGKAVSTWCPASIGAALAAAVMADNILAEPGQIEDEVRAEFNTHFPATSAFLDVDSLGRGLKTKIHGVFDVANLQSLAQLLGVVVENHMAGRGTAFVGLGSSSYSNGNKCYDILKESVDGEGVFAGKNAFHPATHAINPFAQALIFAEDLHRYMRLAGDKKKYTPAEIEILKVHVRKPEPAGAAAFAGYLLTRLDKHSLSALEIAYTLNLVGFTSKTFLEFAGYKGGPDDHATFVQLAHEEGPSMGVFAQSVLALLNWDSGLLETKMRQEKQKSIQKYWDAPLDPLEFEYHGGPTCIYITGDNCFQPSVELISRLIETCVENQARVSSFLAETVQIGGGSDPNIPSTLAFKALSTMNHVGNAVNHKFDSYSKSLMAKLAAKSRKKNE